MNIKKKSQMIRKILPVLKDHDIVRASLFGSYASGKPKPSSDVDLLIEFGQSRPHTLLELIDLEQQLKRKLGKKVDLLTYQSIHPLLKDFIKKSETVIYERQG